MNVHLSLPKVVESIVLLTTLIAKLLASVKVISLSLSKSCFKSVCALDEFAPMPIFSFLEI